MRSSLIVIRSIVAARERSYQALVKHAQLQQSANIKTSKEELPTLMLSDTLDAPSTASLLPKVQGPYTHLQFQDTLEANLELEELFISDSTPTADRPHKSLQQHDLWDCPLR